VSDDKKPTPPSSGSGGTPAACTTAGCPCPSKTVFKEDGDKYGWDDKTDAAAPWKSVEKGNSDTVKSEITPADKATAAEFVSAATAKATVSPAKASSDKQVVTVTGVEKGETEVKSTCRGMELGKFKVATYVKKTKTLAVRLVHEKNYTSTDVSDAAITAALEKAYKQAVVAFTVTRLPAKTVEFDKNKDGKIDVNSWMSAEMRVIRDACKDDSYDFNIFLVDKPTDGSLGFMDFNQRYGFMHADNIKGDALVIAHEVGHAQGLPHTPSDAVNLMHPTNLNVFKLRKDQWDKLNPP